MKNHWHYLEAQCQAKMIQTQLMMLPQLPTSDPPEATSSITEPDPNTETVEATTSRYPKSY